MADSAADALSKSSLEEAVTFAPNHVRFVVPEGGAEEGSVHAIDMEDGRKVEYMIAKSAAAGEEHVVRVDSSVNKMSLTLVKKDKDQRLGITLTNQGDERHPVVTDMVDSGAAAGIVKVGDTFLTISEGSAVTFCSDHDSTSRLLRSARGTLKIEVMRPEVDVPTRIFHSGFLHKRSPKKFLSASVWQRRWFELTATQLIYWELHIHATGPKSQSFLGAQRGSIALSEVAGVRTDAAGSKGANPRRLDVLMKTNRMFELAAASADDATAFATAIRDTLLGVLKAEPAPDASAAETVEGRARQATVVAAPEDDATEEADAATPDELPEQDKSPVIKNVRFKAESVSY